MLSTELLLTLARSGELGRPTVVVATRRATGPLVTGALVLLLGLSAASTRSSR